jgi:phosphonate metabolism-associated iron-containing alcohol dehydrogenase
MGPASRGFYRIGRSAIALTWQYWNPVQIIFGVNAFDQLKDKIAGRSYCLVTYPDAVFTPLVERIAASAGAPACLVRNVEPNPSYASLETACAEFGRSPRRPQVIVALGGGSAIDTAKVVAAADGNFSRVKNHIEGRQPAALAKCPIIAVPTTSGTGSEVTCWATVWDNASKKKYSLAQKDLYPECAIVDPLLTAGAPRALTVSTGLDALSHALESIWNINANPVSTRHAIFAAREVIACLPQLADNLSDIGLRARMAQASLSAGLAFSNTKTALAHSLSYHLTLHHGVPHGIACSFSLPAVMRSAAGVTSDCDDAMRLIFGGDLSRGAADLGRTIKALGVSLDPLSYGLTRDEWIANIENAFEGDRGRNFIGRKETLVDES